MRISYLISDVFSSYLFRGEEQADSFSALGRVRQAGNHQMDDVAAEILIAGGNENLRAGDSEGAVSVRHGPGRKQAKVGSGGGLRQRHGASPLAGDHLRQEGCLQFR